MISSDEILKILQDEKTRLRELGIYGIGLFGSYIRGEATEVSDIDILIDITEDTILSLFSLVELEQSFTEKFRTKVDIAIRKDLKPGIGKKILLEVKYV